MTREIHATASKGFHLQAANYAQTRPTYPKEVVERIKTLIPNYQRSNIIDLAAGTGIMTSILYNAGFSGIKAVEPVEGMRSKLNELLPQVPCLDGTSWKMPFEDASQDAIIVAQAFHWFDDIQSLREFHRVLKPNGIVILTWNMESQERGEWVANIRSLYEVYDAAAPQFRKMYWRKVFETEEAKALFKLPYTEEMYRNDFEVPKENIWKRVLTKSYISSLDKAEQKKLKVKIEEAIKDVPVDNQNRVFYPHETYFVYFRKNE
ncbi:S-adenosyl-L-methionine-dependent methyltransferase [Mycotypha africana]|uniref:S-adenosyl-L-methionine-dependent methyltransferase n=1 Tax=Mycotypha africana TaxID=64632 RepID=UPI0022FFC72F|nr:S-adenosyl-L-methionine-dependent methyltransferase [Mycotypha africana]KAI8975287.1 S-adenosyl-L-methionine-dependent methyltransferase [Mycotypha africana]